MPRTFQHVNCVCRPLFPLVCVETAQSCCCCCSPIHPSIHRILSIVGWKERREEGGDGGGAVKRPCQNKLLPLGCRRHVSGLVGRDDAESDRFSSVRLFSSLLPLIMDFSPSSPPLSCRLTTVTCQKNRKKRKNSSSSFSICASSSSF